MDNLTLLQIAQNCCPAMFNKFLGVASADNFFSNKNLTQAHKLSTRGSASFFYQIVNSDTQFQTGRHWLLFIYIVSPPRRKRVQGKTHREIFIFVWDPLGETISKYEAIEKRLKNLSRSQNKVFQILFPLQNPISNLCGLYCLFMAHYLQQIDLASKVFKLQAQNKQFRVILQSFINRSLIKISNIAEIDIVRYFNKHCNCNFKYGILYL